MSPTTNGRIMKDAKDSCVDDVVDYDHHHHHPHHVFSLQKGTEIGIKIYFFYYYYF